MAQNTKVELQNSNLRNDMRKGKKRLVYLVVILVLLGLFMILRTLFFGDSESDTQLTYQLSSEVFKQPVDHNNPDSGTFEQEILILKPDTAGLNSPVFFILGNEGDATEKRLSKTYKAYGSPKDVIFIQAEHRGYGQSVTADADQSHPDYITIDQALADYHRMISEYKKIYSGPWMGAGYSYGGGLVVNFAHLYPDDVNVILASSAVIDWPFYMPEYDRQVRINLGEDLYNRIAAHIHNLQPEKPFDQIWLEREFLTSMSIGLSQYSQYQYMIPFFKVMSYLPTGAFIGLLRNMDSMVAKGAGWTAAGAFGKSGLSRNEAISGKYNWYTWKYQQCKKTGTFWISENQNGLFPKSKDEILNECRAMFKEEPQAATNLPWNPRGLIRGLSVPVVYTIGGKDPWKELCHEKVDFIPEEDYFFAGEGFHCPDKYDLELGVKVLGRMLEHAR
jgi:pimeloyl-ACP methyl ester carboxylesterase